MYRPSWDKDGYGDRLPNHLLAIEYDKANSYRAELYREKFGFKDDEKIEDEEITRMKEKGE
jgi:hypothetical protein